MNEVWFDTEQSYTRTEVYGNLYIIIKLLRTIARLDVVWKVKMHHEKLYLCQIGNVWTNSSVVGEIL